MNHAPDQPDSLTGRRIGPYQFGEQLGRGGMGEVYKALDFGPAATTGEPRTVAVKRMRGNSLDGARERRMFLREARIATQLSHPFIATVLAAVEYENTPLIVTEYVEGPHLDSSVRDAPLPEARVRELALEIGQALAVIHKAGLVHRDLKPANVLLTPDGHVKVTDFGLSGRSVAAVDPEKSTVPVSEIETRGGTPEYMSPEQVRGELLDARSDLFSLGIVLAQTLVGEHPFQKASRNETMAAILNEPPFAGRRKAPLRGTPLGRLILRLLDKDPGQRFQSADAWVQALQRLQGLPARVSRLPTVALAVGGALTLAALIGLPRWLDRVEAPPTVVAEVAVRPAVAVLSLEDASAGSDPAMARMVAGLITVHLGEATGLRTVSQERVAETSEATRDLPFSERLERTHLALTSKWVLTFRVFREGDDFVGIFDLHDADGGEPRTFTIKRTPASALARPASLKALEWIDGGDEKISDPEGLAVVRSDEVLLLYQRAAESLSNFDYARGLELIEQALERDADFLPARVLFARLLHLAGYQQRALEQAEIAAAALGPPRAGQPSKGRLRVEVTLAELRGDEDEAVRLYEALVRHYPGDPELLLGLAGALEEQGKLERARLVYEQAVHLDPVNPRVHLHLANLFARMELPDAFEGALGEAERLFSVFRFRTGRGEIAGVRAYRLYTQERFAEAEAAYAEAYRLFEAEGLPVRGLAHRKSVADMQLAQWELDQAIATFEGVIPPARRAGHLGLLTRVLNSLGGTLIRLQRLDEAVAALDEATQVAELRNSEPWAFSALANKATVLLLLNRTDEARATARRAMGLAAAMQDEARRCRAASRLIEAERRDGRFDEALAGIRELERCDLEETPMRRLEYELLRHRYELEVDRNAFGAALDAADRALELARSRQPASVCYSLANRARALYGLGRLDEADRDLAEAAALLEGLGRAPEIRMVFDNARLSGRVARQEWESLVVETESRATPKGPDDVTPAMFRVEALRRLGRDERARALSTKLLASEWLTFADRAKIRSTS